MPFRLAASGGLAIRVIPSVLLPRTPGFRGALPGQLQVALLDEVVHQFAGAVVHLDVERLHPVGEVVERHDGGDGDEQAESRRYQRFRNAAGDRADARGLLGRDAVEGVQNADHGAEQANERRGGSDGRETAGPLFNLAWTKASERSSARCELST